VKSRGKKKTSTKRARSALAAQKTSFKKSKMSALRTLANATSAGFLGMETKFFDTYLYNATPSFALDCTGGEMDPSSTLSLASMAQGDGPSDRDGKKAVIKSVQVKGMVSVGNSVLAAVPSTVQRVYVALVLDTGTNGALLSSEDVFQNFAAQLPTNSSPFRNLLWNNRFRILKSQVFDVTPYDTTFVAANTYAHGATSKQFDWYVPLDLPVNFKDTTALTANVVDNSLHIIAFQTGANGKLHYNARVRFVG